MFKQIDVAGLVVTNDVMKNVCECDVRPVCAVASVWHPVHEP